MNPAFRNQFYQLKPVLKLNQLKLVLKLNQLKS